MAIIVATFDTKTKKLDVLMDGSPMDNVHEMSVYKNCCSEGFAVSIMMGHMDEDNKMQRMERIVASNSDEGRDLYEKGLALKTNHPDFYLVPGLTQIDNEVRKLLIG